MTMIGLTSVFALLFLLVTSFFGLPYDQKAISACSPISRSATRQQITSGDLSLDLPVNGILEALVDITRGGGANKFIVYKSVGTDVDVRVEPMVGEEAATGTFTYPADGYQTMPYAVGEIWFPGEGCWRVTATDGVSTVSMDYLVTFVSEW